MKTIRKIMALALVLCMAAAMGVWNTDAHADWYTVQFNKLDNRTFEDIPTGVTLTTTAAASASSADTPAASTAGTAADPQKPGQLEWFYNPWAGTLVIRGRGAMVGFDEKHPAPWHNESKRALRVIIDEGVTTISNEAFKDFIYLRSVVFPSTLKGISATAFEKCEKLKRVEVVTEIKDAEKLIEASKSKELLMDDVKIIRVTKEAVRREICWLTTYWWCRVEIYRDKAGRPIRIIEHKIDGSVIDTGIKYLNEATAVNEAKNPNTAERIYSVRAYPSGAKTAVETEKDEYGANLIKGDYDLNKDGRQVSGTETTLGGNKRTLEDAKYKDNGTGTKYWTEVYQNGYTAVMLEKVDKNDKVLSVETVAYDRNGVVSSRAVTENTYNKDGNKTSTSSVAVDNEGNTLSEATTSYTYSGKKLTGMTTETQEAGGSSKKTEKSFTYDRDGNLATATTETVSQSGSETSTTTTVTSYTYTDTGLKKSATEVETHSDGSVDVTEKKYDKYERPEKEKSVHTDKNGKVTATSETENSYNSEHVRSESIETTTYADGSKTVIVHTYDSDGRFVTAASVTTNAEGKTTSSTTESCTYNGDGKLTSYKFESTNKEGKTSTDEQKRSYDAQGRILVNQYSKTDYDGKKTVYNATNSYDAKGRIVKEISETVNPDGTKSGNTTIYTYDADGNYTKKVIPITTEEAATVKITVTEVKNDGTEGTPKEETVKTEDVQKEIEAVKSTVSPDSAPQTLKNTEFQTGRRLMAFRAVPHDHDYELTEKIPATCTDPSTETYTCKDPECPGPDTTRITHEDPALGGEHEWIAGDPVAPTCTEKGYTPYTCTRCKAEKQDDFVDALGHDWETAGDAVAPTCTEKGYTPYACTRCDAEKEDDFVDALGHDWASGDPVAPTCTEKGYTPYTCTRCDAEKEDDFVDALGHDWASGEAVAATCTEKGYTPYACTRCDAEKEDDFVDALGHDWVAGEAVAATCTDGGYTPYTCTRCDAEKTDDFVDALGHDYKTTEAPASCTEAGSKITTCSRCDYSNTESLPALGHSYQETETPASCTADGVRTYTCSSCGDSYTETIPAFGHSYSSAVTQAPSCTAAGVKTYTCSNCGDSYTESIPATGHSYSSAVTQAPTCTAAGVKTYTCSNCGDTYTEAIPATGHTPVNGVVTTPATCTATGVMTYTCAVCGAPVTAEIPVISHTFMVEVNAETGETREVCAVCGKAA